MDLLQPVLAKLQTLTPLEVAGLLLTAYGIRKAYIALTRTRTTPLRGPVPASWLWGFQRQMFMGDSAAMVEEWVGEYGAVFQIPGSLGSKRVVIADPKAVAHFYAHETFTYQQNPFARHFLAALFGRGILWAEGESHKRQRKILTPAFSNQAIKELTPVFYDSVYKAKTVWDALLDASTTGDIVIDVQNWMNRISLDSIGIAGFSHDFRSLAGEKPEVAEAFESFGKFKPSKLFQIIMVFAQFFPILLNIPTGRQARLKSLDQSMTKISDQLLNEGRKAGDDVGDAAKTKRSLIGTLIKAEKTERTDSSDAGLYLQPEEVLAQMKTLVLAGYETTSISLTWALIELSLHVDKQTKLREELAQLGTDATYDQLNNATLPYLDGVVREVLRLHPPLTETNRMAAVNDVVPLANPITNAKGQQMDRLTIAAKTPVLIPIKAINRSKELWGPDAWEFVPERWIGEEGLKGRRALEVQGWGHILTFVDGPRTCLGRGFAIAEFKAVLSTLIRNFSFAPRDADGIKLGRARTLLPRPKLEGEEGIRMPLRIRRIGTNAIFLDGSDYGRLNCDLFASASQGLLNNFQTLGYPELRDVFDATLRMEGNVEAAVTRLMSLYNFEIGVMKTILTEKGLNLDFSRAGYASIARKVGLDASFSLQDTPTFPLHRARIPTSLFRDIVGDVELAVKQYGLPHEQDNEPTRSRFIASIFSRLSAHFELLLHASLDNSTGCKFSDDRVQYTWRMLGQITILLIHNKDEAISGYEHLNAIAHLIAECISCDFFNYELGYEPARIYAIYTDGTSFDFFRFDGSATPRFARGIQTVPNGFPKARLTLSLPQNASGISAFLLSLRPVCEAVFYFFMLGYEACLDTYCSEAINTTPESIIHRMRRTMPWQESRELVKNALYLALAASEAAMRGDLDTAEQTAGGALEKLRQSVASVPPPYRRTDCHLLEVWDAQAQAMMRA
ncbi:cytochrome P450 [Calocera viscosa TUFC12733]|uniref:Cytochrome P450 n=1 Tax=Calocera viscosa (strain TUFC12733) TaxID=1330018 RepID=A0A167LGN4_CALVF|nr:cytochrome P450 [Calocera viscosa TUFC12733]